MEKKWHNRIRKDILGIDLKVPLVDGAQRPYINLDNAATTPPPFLVVQTVQASSSHSRSTGDLGYKPGNSPPKFTLRSPRQIATFRRARPRIYRPLCEKHQRRP